MATWSTWFLVVLAGLVLIGGAAGAENRVALVIGNARYQHTATLANPRNDAVDLSASLQRLGFQVVLGLDLNHNQMRQTRQKFNALLATADVALFYYAGHALQVDGVNYLVPTDAKLERRSDLEFETVSLDLVLRQMESSAKTTLVFLDACRNNPLARNFTKSSRSAGASPGLARPQTSPQGALIAFATQPGNVARDGAGRNSPFTASLLRNIERPGVELSAMMTDVRRDVYSATRQQQLPWSNSTLLGRFYFNPGTGASDPGQSAATRQQKTIWNLIKDTDDPGVIALFIETYPDSTLLRTAELRLQDLRSASASGASNKPASQTRQVPNLIVPRTQPAPETPVRAPLSRRELVKRIQAELNRVGCDAGKADGQWGRKGRKSLSSFARHANRDLTSWEPSEDLLTLLETTPGRICPLVCGVRFEPFIGQCVEKSCASGQILNRQGNCVKKQATVSKRKSTTKAKKKSTVGGCFQFNGTTICE